MARTARTLGLGLLVAWLAPAQAQAQPAVEFVLEGGGSVTGKVVAATRNTLTIRRDIGGIRQIAKDQLERIEVTTGSGSRLQGTFLAFEDGRVAIESSDARLWLEGNRIVAREPLEAVAGPTQQSPPQVAAAPAEEAGDAGPSAAASAVASLEEAKGAPAASEGSPTALAARAPADEPPEKPAPPMAPGPPMVTVTAAQEQVREGDGEVAFTVELSRPAEETISLVYATVDGEAVQGEDYQDVQGMLRFEPGTTTHELRARLVDDDAAESDETFFLFLFAQSDAARVTPEWTPVVVQDDD